MEELLSQLAKAVSDPSWTDIAQAVFTGAAVVLALAALLGARSEIRAGKLAAAMSGMIELYDKRNELKDSQSTLINLIRSEDWSRLSASGKYEKLRADESLWEAFRGVADFYELVGALVESGALDNSVAFDTFGSEISNMWNGLREAVMHYRDVLEDQAVYNQFARCAERFGAITQEQRDRP